MKKTYRWLLTCAAGLCLALLVMPGAAKAAGCAHANIEDSPQIDATCTEDGYTREVKCKDCGAVLIPGEVIPHPGHTWAYETTRATCIREGKTVQYCSVCGWVEKTEVIPKQEHDYHHFDEEPSKNCLPGVPERNVCSCCGDVVPLKDPPPPAKDHVHETLPPRNENETEGDWCPVCRTIFVPRVDKTNHKCEDYAEPIPDVEPTCTTNGHRGGVQCSVCDRVLENASVIPAKGHTETVTVSYRAATCTREGRTEEIRCSVCGVVLQWSESIPATGHTVVNIPRLEPTETEPGHTAGSYCSDCGTVFTESVEIPATGGNTGGNTGDNPGGNTGGTETPVGPGDNGEPGDEEDLEDPDTPLADKPFLFEDVAKGKWYYDAIYYVYQRGLMNGNNKSGTLFSPNENTNRAMIVTILDLLTAENDLADLMVPLAGEPKSFPDVLAGKWYTEHVLWATAAGIVGGYKEGTFGPLDDVTREQLVVILYQYAGKLGADQSGRADLSGYEDADKVSRYAREAMEWAVDLGLLTGRKDGGVVRLDPKGTATRAEVAVVMMNFCKLVVDAE